MAVKIVSWEIRIDGMWIEVTERSFVNTMRILCDNVQIREGFVLFCNKEGCPIGKMYLKEV